jgi:hypothetical protein
MAVAQKSPIFCVSLPGAAGCFAADSLMPRRRAYSSSSTSLPMPHVASEAGIGCAFSQAPFAYWKKSTSGSTDVSMCAARKSWWGVASAAKAPVEAKASAADSIVVRREIARRVIGRFRKEVARLCTQRGLFGTAGGHIGPRRSSAGATRAACASVRTGTAPGRLRA